MEYHNLKLDKFQEEAINYLDNDNSVVVSSPTGSGKTLIANYIIEQSLNQGKKVFYTGPIKALSNQKYNDFCQKYGEDKVGLLTGDEVINPTAPIVIMTTEVYRNMAVVQDPLLSDLNYIIFDEIHYINDIERGTVWEESIIFSPPHVKMLCLSATIPNAEELSQWIQNIKEQNVKTIIHKERPVPLQINFYDQEQGITDLEKINETADIPSYDRSFKIKPQKPPSHVDLAEDIKDHTPCIFFCFSRKSCQKNAQELAKKPFKEESSILTYFTKRLKDSPKEIHQMNETKTLKKTLSKGIAFHHAGLLPILKKVVEELFSQGKIHYLYATETFAVGINMPAKTVCFENLRKFNGVNFTFLTSKEFFQMAGRAGRRGIDKIGYAIPMIDRNNFSYEKIKSVTTPSNEPIKSQFRLSPNTVLNLYNHYDDNQINEILEKSFYTFQTNQTNTIKRAFRNLLKKLTKLNYIQDKKLTEKGIFASKLFADEIELTEIFTKVNWKTLNNYQILLILACLVYEARPQTKFFKQRRSNMESKVKNILSPITPKISSKAFPLSSIIYPLFEDKNFFQITSQTNMPEGDVIRFFTQIMDRLNQLIKASQDQEFKDRMGECYNTIHGKLKMVYF